jgi:hypothetical protein
MSNLGYYNDNNVRSQIDPLLQEMASLFANTGQDSTLKEIKEAYKKEWLLMDQIAKIDLEFSRMIRPYNEQEWKRNTMK